MDLDYEVIDHASGTRAEILPYYYQVGDPGGHVRRVFDVHCHVCGEAAMCIDSREEAVAALQFHARRHREIIGDPDVGFTGYGFG